MHDPITRPVTLEESLEDDHLIGVHDDEPRAECGRCEDESAPVYRVTMETGELGESALTSRPVSLGQAMHEFERLQSVAAELGSELFPVSVTFRIWKDEELVKAATINRP